jgi:hypothetical protein
LVTELEEVVSEAQAELASFTEYLRSLLTVIEKVSVVLPPITVRVPPPVVRVPPIKIPPISVSGVVELQEPFTVRAYQVTTSSTPNTAKQFFFREPRVLWLIIDNTVTGAQTIQISFDGGETYKTIAAGDVLNLSPFTIPKSMSSIWHKSTAASAPFEILSGERPA